MSAHVFAVAGARTAAAAVGLVLAGATLAACTGGSSTSSDTPSAAPTGSGSSTGSVAPGSVSGSSSASASDTPTASPSNIDQPASTAPVIRNGKTPSPSISASPAPLRTGRAVAYPDGVRLQIVSIRQGTVTADGSKTIAGPKTTFTLKFTNGSTTAVTLNQVVTSASYGTGNLAARPVYDDSDASLRDFAGTVRPGASTTAVYAFSIPTDELSRVTVRVDFDAIHVAANFTGRVQAR